MNYCLLFCIDYLILILILFNYRTAFNWSAVTKICIHFCIFSKCFSQCICRVYSPAELQLSFLGELLLLLPLYTINAFNILCATKMSERACVWLTEYLSMCVCVWVSAVYQSKTAPSCQCAHLPVFLFALSPMAVSLSRSWSPGLLWPCCSSWSCCCSCCWSCFCLCHSFFMRKSCCIIKSVRCVRDVVVASASAARRCRCRFSRFPVFPFSVSLLHLLSFLLARTVLSGFSFLFTGIYGFQRWFCLVFFMCF